MNWMNSINGMNGMYEKWWNTMKNDDNPCLSHSPSRTNCCCDVLHLSNVFISSSKNQSPGWISFSWKVKHVGWYFPCKLQQQKLISPKILLAIFGGTNFGRSLKKPSEGSLPYVEISFGVDFRKQKFTSRGDTERRFHGRRWVARLQKQITFHVSMFVGRNLANQL